MYKSPKCHQISFYDFNQSCGLQLDETNEWIVLADRPPLSVFALVALLTV